MPRWRLAAGVVTAGVFLTLVLWAGRSTDTARDLGGAVGLVDDPPFVIRLAGPLWGDRTQQDSDGVGDVAALTVDEPLRATIRGTGSARVAVVELRVGGRSQRLVRSTCPGGRCPRTLRVSFVPRLDERIRGDRRVQVIARDSQASSGSTDEGSHVSVASFDVRVVPRLPAAVEAEPATGAVSPPAAGLPYRERHAAVRLLADGRRSGELLRLLGNARVRVRAAGALRNGGQTIGATLLLELPVARRNVSATLPGYVPGTGRDTPYLSRSVQWGASALRDLLLDVDLQRRRIISVEPGPASVTTSWSAKDPPAREGLAADPAKVPDIPARPPRLVRVSDGGPAFLAYDGDLGLDPRRHDWPVSLVFAGRATVGKVKNALRPLGFTRLGFTRYLAYRPLGAGATLRFDGDRGLKTHCDAAGTDVHIRFYAPAATDRFADAKLGSVVVATSHLDHNDGCGTGPARYGFSGIAERRIGLLARRLGWRVEPNRLTLGNAESYRRDVGDPSHLWLGDGRATLIWVP